MCKENNNLEHKRHTLAHLLAASVIKKYPDVKLTLGPAVDNGFYYDIDFGNTKPEEKDLKEFQKTMRKTLSSWTEFTHKEVSVDEAREIYKDNPYKLELVNEIAERGEKITLYTCGEFTDLCRGGHSENPAKEIDGKAFELTHMAGAYWRGDENNTMLTRIYGVAFDTPEELANYKEMLEEAKKRDHKKIGKELGLFTFSDKVGSGLPLFMPKGNIMRDALANFVRKEKEKLGYQFVWIPHIAKKDLYITSGHMGKYDAMMPTMSDENGEELVMKAMNCPHHFEIFNAEPHSYRDLPLRLAENSTVYRNEKSGELSGLLRVKSLTQDDTHHFVREDQIESEIEMIIGLMENIYSRFGFTDYKVEISIRDLKNKENYFGDDEIWDKAEAKLIEAVKKWGVEYSVEEGEAAFYGPKIDVRVKDALGRDWQLTTVQLDFNQPVNFDMTYTGQDGKPHRPVVIHVAILGSIERFMGVLIEHYAGVFPLWLSPIQVTVMPVNDDAHGEYAQQVLGELQSAGIRAEYADATESLGKRMRNAKKAKVPYVFVLGDKEKESSTITAEGRNDEKLENISVADFITKVQS